MSSENSEKVDSSTPISASKNSILQAVIGDGSFEHLMKERTKVSWLHGQIVESNEVYTLKIKVVIQALFMVFLQIFLSFTHHSLSKCFRFERRKMSTA